MTKGITEIVETEEDLECVSSSTPIVVEDIRAEHCKTAKELQLFKYSSNYQSIQGGNSSLEAETGLAFSADNGSVSGD